MNRTLIQSNTILPAVKLVKFDTKGKGVNTAVHIGWRRENGKVFCLCGQEVIIGKTDGKWVDVAYNECPEITCGRCKKIWQADRTRNIDTGGVFWHVLNREVRMHLKGNSSGNSSSRGVQGDHPSDDNILERMYGPYRFDRKLPYTTLVGMVGITLADRYVWPRQATVHLATINNDTGVISAVCNHTISGNTVGTSDVEYKERPYITCPHCIQYIIDNELDAPYTVMVKRQEQLRNLKSHIDALTEQLDDAKAEYDILVKKTLLSGK